MSTCPYYPCFSVAVPLVWMICLMSAKQRLGPWYLLDLWVRMWQTQREEMVEWWRALLDWKAGLWGEGFK